MDITVMGLAALIHNARFTVELSEKVYMYITALLSDSVTRLGAFLLTDFMC